MDNVKAMEMDGIGEAAMDGVGVTETDGIEAMDGQLGWGSTTDGSSCRHRHSLRQMFRWIPSWGWMLLPAHSDWNQEVDR
jgi:hypothetical protein